MTDKYKALRDALADDSLALRHIAVAEHGVCRFMTGRKLPPHLESMELHGIDSGRSVHDSIAVPKEAVIDLLAERDAQAAEIERLRSALKEIADKDESGPMIYRTGSDGRSYPYGNSGGVPASIATRALAGEPHD